MAVTALIDVSPGVLINHHQVEKIKDAIFKLLLPFERTAFPLACHVIYFDSSLSPDGESERIAAVRNQSLWGTSSGMDNANRMQCVQEPGDSLESNKKHHRQRLRSGQSCGSSYSFDELSRQLDGFLRDSRPGTSSCSYLTQSSLWRAIDKLLSTKCRCTDVSGRRRKNNVRGYTNPVVTFSSVARTDDEVANFFELSEFQRQSPHAVEAAMRSEGAGTGIDSIHHNLFVRELKDHSERLRTAGFEVQWADLRWEGKSHAYGSASVNTTVLDAIHQVWSSAGRDCGFQGTGLLVPHIEAWLAKGKHHKSACRGQLGWRNKTFATVSLIQIKRGMQSCSSITHPSAQSHLSRSEPFPPVYGTESEEKVAPREEMGESVTLTPTTIDRLDAVTACRARPEFHLVLKDIRPVARLDLCRGTGEAYLLLPPPLEAGRKRKAVAPVQDVHVGGKGGSGRMQAWLHKANASTSGRGEEGTATKRGSEDKDLLDSGSFKLGSLMKKMEEWGEYPVVKVVQGLAGQGEKREVGYGVLCPYTSTTFTLRMVDKASLKELMPFPKAFSHDQMRDFGSWSPSPREGSQDRYLRQGRSSWAGCGDTPHSVDDESQRGFAEIPSQETCESLMGRPSGSSACGVLDGDVSRSAPVHGRVGGKGREEKLMRQLEAVETAVAEGMGGRQQGGGDEGEGEGTTGQECEEEVARYPSGVGGERAVEVVRRMVGRLRPALARGREEWQEVEKEIYARFCTLLHDEEALESWVEKWMAVLSHHPESSSIETDKAMEVKEAEIQMVFGMEVLAEYERRSCVHPEEAAILGGIANLFQACKDEVPFPPHDWFRTAIASRYRRRLRTLLQKEMQGGQGSRKAEAGYNHDSPVAETQPAEETRSMEQPPPVGRTQVAMTQRQMTIRGFKKRTKRAMPPAGRPSGAQRGGGKENRRERKEDSVLVSATPSPQADRKGSRTSGKGGQEEEGEGEGERGSGRKSRDLKYGAKLKGNPLNANPSRTALKMLVASSPTPAKAGSSPVPPPPPSSGKKSAPRVSRVMHLLDGRVALEDEEEPHTLPLTPTQESPSPPNQDPLLTIGEGQASNMPPCLHSIRHRHAAMPAPTGFKFGYEAGGMPTDIGVAAHARGVEREESRWGEEEWAGGEEEDQAKEQLQACGRAAERVSSDHTGGSTADAQPLESERKRERQEVEEEEPAEVATKRRREDGGSGEEDVCAESVEGGKEEETGVSGGEVGDRVCLTMTVAGSGTGHPKLQRWEAEIPTLFSEYMWDYIREQNKSFVEAMRLATKDGRDVARAVFQQEYERLEGRLEGVLRRVRNSCTAEYMRAHW